MVSQELSDWWASLTSEQRLAVGDAADDRTFGDEVRAIICGGPLTVGRLLEWSDSDPEQDYIVHAVRELVDRDRAVLRMPDTDTFKPLAKEH